MALEGGVRRRRRTHILVASLVMLVILVVGMILQILPGSGPQFKPEPQQAAPNNTNTPFGQAFSRGLEAMRLGDAHAAAIAFDQARAINSKVPEAHVNLGFAYLAMKRHGEAATAFDNALTVNPKQLNAYYGLGTALDAAGDRQGAIGAMRTYVHLASKEDPFHRKALAALWEWEAAAKGQAGKRLDEAPKTETAAVSPRPAVPRADAKLLPLPAIAETPDALKPPEGMIAIVNFWASWCGPCREEMPSLQKFAAALDPARYRLVGLNIDKDRDFAREFMRSTGVSFDNFWDGKGAFARERYQVESYPQTLFLDSSGTVVARVAGAREWPAETAQQTVAEILAAGQRTEQK